MAWRLWSGIALGAVAWFPCYWLLAAAAETLWGDGAVLAVLELGGRRALLAQALADWRAAAPAILGWGAVVAAVAWRRGAGGGPWWVLGAGAAAGTAAGAILAAPLPAVAFMGTAGLAAAVPAAWAARARRAGGW